MGLEEEIYQWNPYKGLGNISFYFSELELVNVLGKPDDLLENRQADDSQTRNYHYHNLAVIVSFVCTIDKRMFVRVSSGKIFLKKEALHLLSFRQLLAKLRREFVAYTGIFADGHPAPSEKIVEYKRIKTHHGKAESLQYAFPYLGAVFWYENGRMVNALVQLPEPLNW